MKILNLYHRAIYFGLTFLLLTAVPCYGKKKTPSYDPADQIISVILKYSLPEDIDAKSVHIHKKREEKEGIESLRKKIRTFLEQSKPLTFTLVGFPFKSPNRTKCIGDLPDYAERKALEKLHMFLNEVSKYTHQNSRLLIYTDGFAFCDLLGISLKTVIRYEDALKVLIKDLPGITLVTCRDLFPDMSPDRIQKYIKDRSCSLIPLSETEEKVLTKRLLKELDYPEGRTILGKASPQELAKKMHRRSQKINAIYAEKFPEAIALSVHFQKNISKKIGISLSQGNITPWHGVCVVRKDGSFEIQFCQEVSREATLRSKEINGQKCLYYSVSHDRTDCRASN